MNIDAHMQVIHKELINHGTFHSCYNCEHWDIEAKVCSKYLAVPPVRVIALGCEEWMQDIPF